MKTFLIVLPVLVMCDDNARRQKRNPSPYSSAYPLSQGFARGPFGGFGFGGFASPGLGFGGFGAGYHVGHPGFGGKQIQNCLGSQCQQNNQNVQGVSGHQGLGGVLGGGHGRQQLQNCLGSQCQQNNHNVQGAVGHLGLGGGLGGGHRGQQLQNCLGSQCQQNNQNVQGAGIVPAVTSSQTQNCQGSQCLQNNLAAGRRRRRSTEGRFKRFLPSSIVRFLITRDGFIDHVIKKRY